jgi:prevent-host-death family protein
MKAPNVAEDIVPIGEFKTRISAMLRRIRESRRPIVITQNGRATAVVMSPVDYEAMVYRENLVDAVNAGLEDVRAGRVIDDAELVAELDARYGKARRR